MKTHDYHVFMQQILPVAVRCGISDIARAGILKISHFFRMICARTIDPSKLESLQLEVVEALCVLERSFPPSFFDIMTHLVVHLVEEIRICGPVSLRWMYPFERVMKPLKQYVKNKARPEGCMVATYAIEEALGFYTEYIQAYEGTSRRVWDGEEDPRMNSVVPEGKGTIFYLDSIMRHQAHVCILDNSTVIEEWKR